MNANESLSELVENIWWFVYLAYQTPARELTEMMAREQFVVTLTISQASFLQAFCWVERQKKEGLYNMWHVQSKTKWFIMNSQTQCQGELKQWRDQLHAILKNLGNR